MGVFLGTHVNRIAVGKGYQSVLFVPSDVTARTYKGTPRARLEIETNPNPTV